MLGHYLSEVYMQIKVQDKDFPIKLSLFIYFFVSLVFVGITIRIKFLYFRRVYLYQTVMQSRSFDHLLTVYCMCYLQCYTYVKAYKVGKCSCPTTFTSCFIHLYNGLFCSCCLSFQLDADFCSFYNPVRP